MRAFSSGSYALARFFLSAIFLVSSIHKMFHWAEFERILNGMFNDWQTYGVLSEPLQNTFMHLANWTPALLILSTSFELIGGLFVLLGLKERLGAFLLILFLIPATVLFHPFWLMEGMDQETAILMFMKNLSIFGGLMLVVLNGAQSRSSIPLSYMQ